MYIHILKNTFNLLKRAILGIYQRLNRGFTKIKHDLYNFHSSIQALLGFNESTIKFILI